jgi:hypothetical protein
MKNLTFFLLIFLLLPFPNLSAQKFTQKNTWEIGGRINFTNTTNVNNGEPTGNALTDFSLNIPIYYFVIDGLSLGFIPGFEFIREHGGEKYLLALLAGLAYNFKTNSAAYPYLEGRFGYNTSSGPSGIIWIISGGLKVQVGGNALLGIGLAYEQSTFSSSGNDGGRNGTNRWGVDVGFSIFFGI